MLGFRAELGGLFCTMGQNWLLKQGVFVSFLFAFASYSIFLAHACPSVSSPLSLSFLSLLISPLALRSICAPHSPYAPAFKPGPQLWSQSLIHQQHELTITIFHHTNNLMADFTPDLLLVLLVHRTNTQTADETWEL